jgi:hypothetical protein
LSTIEAAFCLSLLIHAALLWFRLPPVPMHPLEMPTLAPPKKDSQVQLDVYLPSSRRAQPVLEVIPPPLPTRRILQATAPKQGGTRLPRAERAPRAMTNADAEPDTAATPREPTPQLNLDLRALLEQGVAAYNSAGREGSLASETEHRGGIFQVSRVDGDEYAEFYYAGWSAETRRNVRVLYSVRRGSDPNIRVAVVRRVIRIIREQWTGDFDWASRRLGRNVTMSARPADSAALEAFLIQEFFVGDTPARWGASK